MQYSYNKIRLSLEEELKKSQAPITGFLIACAVITEKNIYFNHNFEKENSDMFEHAENNALKEILRQEKNPLITKIIMLAGGKVRKFKNYAPCSMCSHALVPYMKTDTTIELLPTDDTSKRLRLKFSEVLKSYAKLEYSKIKSTDKSKLKSELRKKLF